VQVNRTSPGALYWWWDVEDWAARWPSISLQQGLVGSPVGRIMKINKEEPWILAFMTQPFRTHNTDPL